MVFKGEVQGCQSPGSVESRRHCRDATPDPPVSSPWKAKLSVALLEIVLGLVSIAVSADLPVPSATPVLTWVEPKSDRTWRFPFCAIQALTIGPPAAAIVRPPST